MRIIKIMITGERLKKLRKNQDLSQAQLAEKIGTDGNTISRWERGVLEIGKKKLILLAESFNTSVAYLLGETDDPIRQSSKQKNFAAARSQ